MFHQIVHQHWRAVWWNKILRRLDNGDLIQIDLHHEEKEGEIIYHATVYGVRFKLRKDSAEAREAREEVEMILFCMLGKIGKIEVLTED